MAVLSFGHYSASPHDPFWHDLFRRLLLADNPGRIPIWSQGRHGDRGHTFRSFFLPHVLMTRATLPRQASEAAFEIPLYISCWGDDRDPVTARGRLVSRSRRAERLKTLGEMAAGMAHEVKNPLAAIRSSAQILAGRADGRDVELARHSGFPRSTG